MTIRLLLCDDQDIVTEGMGVILRTVRDFAVVGVARDGAEAVDLVAFIERAANRRVLSELLLVKGFANNDYHTEVISKENVHVVA